VHPLDPDALRSLLDKSLAMFFARETKSLLSDVSEQDHCRRLAIYVANQAELQGLTGYYADVE
jgi:hypothetical protein